MTKITRCDRCKLESVDGEPSTLMWGKVGNNDYCSNCCDALTNFLAHLKAGRVKIEDKVKKR